MRVFVVVVVVLIAACRRETPPAAPPPKSDVATPAQIEASARAIAKGNVAFAFELFGQLTKSPGNVLVAPYGVASALALTSAGTRGKTQAELTLPLHAEDHLHDGFLFINRPLFAAPQLTLANRLFVAGSSEVLAPFAAIARDDYAAGAELIDFSKPDARLHLNQWVEGQTRHRVAQLVPEGRALAADAQVVLATAAHFKGRFQSPFDPKATRPRPFQSVDGAQLEVPTMTQPASSMRLAEVDGVQVLDLPYRGGRFAMVVLLPKDLAAFEAGLDAPKFASLLSKLKPQQVRVSFPRFTLAQTTELKPALTGLGITSAFGPSADFSGLTASPGLRLSSVAHAAVVEVNEDNVEAPPSTNADAGADGGTPAELHTIDVNRPFDFVILDVKTGMVAFVGRVVDPRATQRTSFP